MTDNQLFATVDPPWIGLESTPDLFSLLCQRRGWTDDYLTAIDKTDHDRLKDLDTMVAALEDIRTQGKTITIAPDFDMDGISSGVLGYAGLSELGFTVNMHMPDYRRGHDLSPADIEEIHQRYPKTDVLLTCDGGVNSHAGLGAAKDLGWMTLVTDHHQELEPGCPADITVNPCRIDETYALRGICGAHVLYQILEAYALAHQPFKLWSIRLLRLFAGLGTVSDVMPILYENRQLVRDSLSIARLLHAAAPLTIENRWGRMDPDPDAINVEEATLIQLLRHEDHHPVFLSAFEGFALMLKAFAQHGKVRDLDDLDEGFYGFYLAPAMNSPRRTGAPLDGCFNVFILVEPEAKLKAMHRVIENNDRRKELVIEHMDELLEVDQPLAPWVYFSSAYTGMYGLLASKLMERNGHAVVVANWPHTPSDFVAGSGRAPDWFEIITTLEPHPGLMGIGHQQACGVKVERAELLGELVGALQEATRLALLEQADQTGPIGDLVLGSGADCDASLSDTEPLKDLVRRIEKFKPFGHAFTEPMFEIVLGSGFRVEAIGSEKQHLRLITTSGLACLWWNAAEEHFDDLKVIASDPASMDLRFLVRLQLNTFLGETRLQVVISAQL